MITKGLNDANNLANDSYKEQWLSSCTISCLANPYGNVNRVREGNVTGGAMFWANGKFRTRTHLVRSVVTLKLDAQFVGTNNDGILEVKE